MGRLEHLEDWLDYQQSLHNREIDLGLERITQVFNALFPQGVPFQVISVAGTNGKGSTCAFIESILQLSPHKVGKFSSPHITHYNERFNIDGIQASDEQIINAFTDIETARGEVSLTYFEFSTLAALLIFAKAKVDVAVLEVGLGGRLDSVNVVDADISVISNIAIDHTEYLGETREQIAREKAGIMRAGKPCVCADPQPPSALSEYANTIGAELIFINQAYAGKLNLSGEHQRYNAALAQAAIAQLQLDIEPLILTKGIEQTQLPGRFEKHQIQQKQFVLDVAHNEAAVEVLAQTLAQERVPTLAIFSVLKDKQISAMIGQMRPQINQWLLVPLEEERAIEIGELSQLFALEDKITVCQQMQEALNQALNSSYSRVVIFGSFYTVALAKKSLDQLN